MNHLTDWNQVGAAARPNWYLDPLVARQKREVHASLLHRWLPVQRVQQLDSRLLRPLYLLATALILIGNLDSLQELAVVPLGTVMGVPLYLGRLLSAVVVSYLVLVGSGPPAAGVAWLVVHLPRAFSSDPARKGSWIAPAARVTGSLRGSLKHRTVYL